MDYTKIMLAGFDVLVIALIVKAMLIYGRYLPRNTYAEISLYAVISLAYVGYLEVHRQVEGKN